MKINHKGNTMKYLLVLLTILAIPAHAQFGDRDLGQVVCPTSQCTTFGNPNQTNATTWGTHRMRSILGSAPNNGNGCPEVEPGKQYHLHIKIRCGVGPACAFMGITATAGDIPTIGNSLQWTNIITSMGCIYHPGWWNK